MGSTTPPPYWGSIGVGVYGVSVAYRATGGSSSPIPGIPGTVIGFIIAATLVATGVVSRGMYNEIEEFRVNKETKARMTRDSSGAYIGLGIVTLVLFIVKLSLKNNRVVPGRREGIMGGMRNAMSTFFTY